MTSSNYTEAQRAEGKIGIAIQRAVGKYLFHCRVLEQFKIQQRSAVGTMAVTVSGGAILLLYNAGFVLRTPMTQLVGVLLHEVHHVVFSHVFADPANYPDRWARTIAKETTVNEFVKEPLPAGVILLKDFPCLSSMQSTDHRYDILKKETVRKRIIDPVGPPLGEGQGSAGSVLDDHTAWEEAQRDAQNAKATIESILGDVVMDVGRDRVPSELKDALGKMGIGDTPGGGQYDLLGGRHGQLDWRRLLRRYAGQILQVRATFSRPSRRFPNLVGIVPGKCRQGERPRVMAIIDTSGSIATELLELINAELALLARHHTVIVVECDAEVHAVYEYLGPLAAVHGRGGTDFRPPLARKFLRKHRPDLVVYFTDGFGPAAPRGPQVPVVWCLTPGGQRPRRGDV
ncbi:MAG: VWA-like domain-containing protein [Planctomycetota bacterium]